jgi:hypothetical protein
MEVIHMMAEWKVPQPDQLKNLLDQLTIANNLHQEENFTMESVESSESSEVAKKLRKRVIQLKWELVDLGDVSATFVLSEYPNDFEMVFPYIKWE